MSNSSAHGQRGFTLIEMVLAIVVLGVGVAGVLLAFSTVTRGSADPVVAQQMLAVGEEMLEEIQLKPYLATPNAAPTNTCARNTFNDVLDYNNYSSGAGICTIDGSAITSLSAYAVSVQVVDTALVGVATARQISVTVTRGSDVLKLTGWRTDYAS